MVVEYRKATFEDIGDIAFLHMNCFKDYFLTSFGCDLVKKYYEEFFLENNLFVVAENNGSIIGFCMGYLAGSKAREIFEKKYSLRILYRIILKCLMLDKMAISKCILRIKQFIKKSNVKCVQNFSKRAELLSICVSPEFRGFGIADRMVMDFEDLLRNIGVQSYSLSVYKTNTHAQHFYSRLGFNRNFEDGLYYEYKKSI